MRRNQRMFRLTATVALTALLCDVGVPLGAIAQPAPPPLPQPNGGRPELSQGDPPARVGRIARLAGTVSFHNQGDSDWTAAAVNYPVSSGNTFWTEPAAEAHLEIGASRIALAGGTEFDVSTLDASGLQAVADQGEAYLNLRDLAPNEAWSVQTPRGVVRLAGQGRYEIVVGSSDQPTLVTVVDGSAEVEGPGVSLRITGSQTATIVGTDSFQGSVGPALRDGFLTASLDAERPPPPPAVAVPRQVATMPGGSDLLRDGSWSEAPSYGHVWYPPVSAEWVPYRDGHWAYVAPWGWTWIDNAPWGFAPFHYGRWIQVGPRWAWTPGAEVIERPPVYAPALVTFIGIGAGVAIGAALASGSIGWVPLGPREPYRPWYHASDRYVRQVNINHVTNINDTTINNRTTINNFVNRGAATSVPAAAMTGSQPVRGVARPITAQEFAAARPIVGQQPIRPTASTVGVTPAVAQRMNLAPAAAFRSAPGPAIRTQPAGGLVRPAFAPAANVPAAAAVAPGQQAPIGVRPGGVPGGPRPDVARPDVARTKPPGPPGPSNAGLAPGALAPGALPRGALPPGASAPGTLAPGASAPGTLAPGALPPGASAPGTLPRGALAPGESAPGALPRGALAPGTLAPGGQVPRLSTPGAAPQQIAPPMSHGEPPRIATQPPVGTAPARLGLPQAQIPPARPEPPGVGAPRLATPQAVAPAPRANAPHGVAPAPPQIAAPAQRPVIPNVVAPPPRAEPRIAAPAPQPHIAAPAPQPPHFAAPAPTPQHFAPPAPAPQPPHFAPPPPAPARQPPPQREKRPGER